MSEDVGEFGALLCGYRKSAGLSQEELAERAGLTARAISSLERGRTLRPQPHSVRRLAEALELRDEQRAEFIAAAGRRLARAPAAAPKSPPTNARMVVPRQLPAAVRHFTGRRTELKALTDFVGEADAGGAVVISAIEGMAGVGKTALAVHAAHLLAERFPHGQLFIDLHGYTQGHAPRPPGDALDWLLRALNVPPQEIPQDVDERAALYRQRLADTRTLIVLDNAASEAQVRPLLPGSAGCLVLVTSRRHLKGLDDAHTIALDVLPHADAIALLRAGAGPARVWADDPALAEIAELCGRLPLALRIAGALLRHRPAWPSDHLARLLSDPRQRITALSDGDRDLGNVLDLSYESLTTSQQRLFRCLGLLPGPDIDAYAAAALIDTDPPAAARLLESLIDHNLLTQQVPDRYRLHDLIRLHARTLLADDPVTERDAALGRLLDYYQDTASRADARVAHLPQPALGGPVPAHAPALSDPDAAWTWLRSERQNLLAATNSTVTNAYHQRLVALTAGLATLLRTYGPWPEAIALHTTAVVTAGQLGDQRGRASALNRLGDVRALTGDFPGAVHDLAQALGLYRGLGDRLGQANALTRLGDVREMTGDPRAASDLEEALELYRDLGERLGQAAAVLRLGEVRRMTGDLPGAARHLEDALQLYRDLGERSGQANALLRLAEVRRYAGDLPGATRDHREALQLYRDLGDRRGQANTLTLMGEVRRAVGDFTAAAADLQEALQVYRDLGHRLGQANALTLMGQVRHLAGDYPGAISDLEEALDLFRRIGARGNEAWALNRYAAAIAATGDHKRAEALYHDALQLARETHQPDDEAPALEGIGECHLHTGDTKVGMTHLKQALGIFERVAMKPDADRVRTRLVQLSKAE